MTAGTEFFCSGFAELFHQFDSHVCNGGRRFFHTQFFCLEIAVVEAVEEAKNAILKALKRPLKKTVSEKTDPGKGAAL